MLFLNKDIVSSFLFYHYLQQYAIFYFLTVRFIVHQLFSISPFLPYTWTSLLCPWSYEYSEYQQREKRLFDCPENRNGHERMWQDNTEHWTFLWTSWNRMRRKTWTVFDRKSNGCWMEKMWHRRFLPKNITVVYIMECFLTD